MQSSDNKDQSQQGGRSLGGSTPSEPLPTEWARPSAASRGVAPRSGQGRFATLRDIGGAPGPSIGGPGASGGFGGMGVSLGSEDDEAADGDENDGGENWYAGGERSGISVANPDRRPRQGNHLVRDILRKAAETDHASHPPSAPSGPFSGSAYKLGSDEVQSTFVPDPNAPQDLGEDDAQEVAIRYITFWREGFSVEDGPLLRYDEPANSQLLDEINSGHAPPQVLNVRVGQPVELRVTRRLEDDYVPPAKRPLGAFEGQGHRLGAAVPDTATSGLSSNPSMPGTLDPSSIPGSSQSSSSRRSDAGNIQPQFEVDQTMPTTSVQVRLADGTRLVARMNLHHTVGDIRNFINASRPGSSSTPYTIQTTFPTRVLEDNAQTIEEAGLKNSVIVQRIG